jgi:hypothetical protein
MKNTDLAWLAGLLEGEGCFRCDTRKYTLKSGEKKSYLEPVIHLQMTDLDVMERAASLLGTTLRTYQDNKGNRKLLYRTSLNGKKRAIPMMRQLLPLMGQRRQERIAQVILQTNGRNTYSTTTEGMV